MPNLERITVQTAGVLLEEVTVPSFVSFVEELAVKETGFAIYPLSELNKHEKEEFPGRQRPLIAYSGRDTFARLVDPEGKMPGVFAISNRALIYHENDVLAPLQDRDSYRWSLLPWSYFIDSTVDEVIGEFERNGYGIYLSVDSVFEFGRGNFQKTEKIALEELHRRVAST